MGLDNPQVTSWGFLILMFAVLYFFMILPQRKQKKARQAMLAALKVGDRVVSVGGIYGDITEIDDERVRLKVAEATVLSFRRSAVGTMQPDQPQPAAEQV